MNKKSQTCDYEKYLIDALDGTLLPFDQETVDEHLKRCASCSALYHESEKIHALLMNRHRPDPPKEVLSQYRVVLN